MFPGRPRVPRWCRTACWDLAAYHATYRVSRTSRSGFAVCKDASRATPQCPNMDARATTSQTVVPSVCRQRLVAQTSAVARWLLGVSRCVAVRNVVISPHVMPRRALHAFCSGLVARDDAARFVAPGRGVQRCPCHVPKHAKMAFQILRLQVVAARPHAVAPASVSPVARGVAGVCSARSVVISPRAKPPFELCARLALALRLATMRTALSCRAARVIGLGRGRKSKRVCPIRRRSTSLIPIARGVAARCHARRL